MHLLDTIKTRQQAAPHAEKYKNTLKGYITIWKEEGFFKGLYLGYSAAMLGLVPRGVTFFGTYEWTKRKMIGSGVNDTVTHLTAGMLADLVTSVVFVPSEVLKARLQVQGRYNNPYFNSGYNYKGLGDAIRCVAKEGGWLSFYSGYKATLCRDLPFSALQFAFYEKFRAQAFIVEGYLGVQSLDLGLFSELMVGGFAGGLTGFLTTPLDVVKTRIQTQNGSVQGNVVLGNSIYKGLITVYRSEGLGVLFSGFQPRFVWTFIQSSVMLLAYQEILKAFKKADRGLK